jgi:lipoprotein-releasing system permease protein
LSAEKFIADRIYGAGSKGSISRPIVKIAVLGITLGVAVMLLTVCIVPGFKREIVGKISGLTTDIAISSMNVTPGNEPAPIRLPLDTLQMIHALPFVRHIQQTAFKNGLLKTESENEGLLLKGVDRNYDFSFLKSKLVDGTLPAFEKNASHDMLISKSLSDRLKLKTGEKASLYFISQHQVFDSTARDVITKSEQRSRRFRVCGIFDSGFSEFDDRLAIVDLRQIRAINFWDSTQVGAYEIRVTDLYEIDDDSGLLQLMLGYNYQVRNVKELYYSIFSWLEKLDVNGIIVVVLMIAVAVANMITALLILILERTSMIGILKATGMANRRVRRIFFLLSLKLAGKGLLRGNLVGLLLCTLQYYFHVVKLDSTTYYTDHVAIEFDWVMIVLLNIGTFIVCSLMLFLPTLVISRLTPVRTLKFD